MTVSRWGPYALILTLAAPGCTLFVSADSYRFGEDAGRPDAGAMDAGPADAEVPDAGDARVDAGGSCVQASDCAPRSRATMDCRVGECVVVGCESGWDDCDGALDNGCEADLTASCGVCGAPCPAGCEGAVCDPIVDLALGHAVSCAVRTSGQVFCWGPNDQGQLGQADLLPRARPTRVPGVGGIGFLDAVDISVHAEGPTQATVCAVLRTGALACWGNNTYGSAGSSTSGTPVTSPRAVSSTDAAYRDGRRFVSVSTSVETSCALDDRGEVWCWGRNTAGELGVPTASATTRASAERVVFSPGATLAEVHVGLRFACARTTARRVLCWGRDWGGNLGDGTGASRHLPMPTAPSIDDAEQLSVGAQFACARRTDGTVWCWGVGAEGQLGRGTTAGSLVPVEATELSGDVVSIGTGYASVIATTGTGTHLGVGRDRSGELGQGSAEPFRLRAVSPVGVPLAATLHAGRTAMCAVSGGGALCWGDDRFGQLAVDEGLVAAAPVDVALSRVLHISLGAGAGCLRAGAPGAEGAFCFGRNTLGQLGIGGTESTATPTRPTLVGLDRPSAGGFYACGIAGGEAYCWGTNGNGRLGDGTLTPSSTPQRVVLSGSETRISAAGQGHTCAIQAPGAVYCWGYNATGALGRGSVGADEPMPGPAVMGIGDALELASGHATTCALRASRRVACWGSGTLGQIGDGMLANRSVATAVPGLMNVIALAAGANHVCAIAGASAGATEGIVYCWGDNSTGAVGDPASASAHATPFAVGPGGGITDAIALGTGAAHTCALRASGEILCWGDNGAMQLGDGTQTPRTSPVPSHTVLGAVGLSAGATGVATQCAWRADETAVCWGSGVEGTIASAEPLAVTTPTRMRPFGGSL